MDYQINYGFLQSWLDSNPQFTKKDILNALDSTDYVTLNRWIKGDRPMQPDAMCRFCNYFNVPLSCFFRDGDAIADVAPVAPTINDQLQPNGGYPDGAKGRGENGVNPTTSEHMQSHLPMEAPVSKVTIIEPQQMQVTGNVMLQHQLEMAKINAEHIAEMGKLRTEYTEKIAEIHKNYSGLTEAERDRYLTIIETLNDKITELTKRNISYHHTDTDYSMAAEDAQR